MFDRIYPSARAMTKSSIENGARIIGFDVVAENLVSTISEKMDMRKEPSSNDTS